MSDGDQSGSNWLLRILHGIAGVALVAMMLIVVADVALRFAFRAPIQGTYDIVSICLLVMVFFGIGPVIAKQGEIVIDLIDQFIPAGGLRWLRLIAALGTVGLLLFLGWSMIGPAHDAYSYGDRSLELGLAVWLEWAVAFVGLAGIVVLAVQRAWNEIRGGKGK